MNTLRTLLGKMGDFATIVTAAVVGFVSGMVVVHAVDTMLALILTSVGFTPLGGVVGAIVGMALGLCYTVIYLTVALKVMDKVETFINDCHRMRRTPAFG